VDSFVDYFGNDSFIEVLSDLFSFVEDVVRCNRSEHYDGTLLYNPYCLQLPEKFVLFDPPRFADYAPLQIQWDPSYIVEDCQLVDSPRTWIFDTLDDNCKLNDSLPRPLCDWCHYCKRTYSLVSAAIGDVIDHLLVLINYVEAFLVNLLAAEVKKADTTMDKVHFLTNCVLAFFFVYFVVGFFFPVFTQYAVTGPIFYILWMQQWAWGIGLMILCVFVGIQSGIYASMLAFWMAWIGFMILFFLSNPIRLKFTLVCWIATGLRYLRSTSMLNWVPGLLYFYERFDLLCYEDHHVPREDFQAWLLGISKTAAALILTGLFFQIFLRPLLVLLTQLLLWILHQIQNLLFIWQNIRMLRLRLQVYENEDDLHDLENKVGDLKTSMDDMGVAVDDCSDQTLHLFNALRRQGTNVDADASFLNRCQRRWREQRGPTVNIIYDEGSTIDGRRMT
jgi:hypothetical protein